MFITCADGLIWNYTQIFVHKLIKGIVCQRKNAQVIQDVGEMVSSSEQIWRNVASLAHQWILCSEWVPSEWESKQHLIKTSQ